MNTLHYIDQETFKQVLSCDAPMRDKTQAFATLCRINTLYMIMRGGSGHVGSSFSSLDLVSWIYLNELRDNATARDLYFSSKGHDAPGLYSVHLALGLLDQELLHQFRQFGGLPGHPDIQTKGTVFNTGSLGMGISKAKGLILADRLKKIDRQVFVMTGDGELQEGQIWESLAGAVNNAMGELTVIVDRNHLQSDTWIEYTSHLGELETKFKAFGWFTVECDGHSHASIEAAFKACRQSGPKPRVVIANTAKGSGVSFMEPTLGDLTPYKYHSGAPSPNDYSRALKELSARMSKQLCGLGLKQSKTLSERYVPDTSPVAPQKLVSAYAQALLKQGENDQVVVLDGDLKYDCGLGPFADSYPDRFIECGIAEQDMVSMAGGLAAGGMLPVVHSFASFLTQRANEHIYNNATERRKIIYAGSLAGVAPGPPGHTHQSVRDIGILSGIPGLEQMEPCCESEVEMLVDYAFNQTGNSVYIRLVSNPWEIPFTLPEDYTPEPGKGVILHEGEDATIIGYGPVTLTHAWHAAQALAKEKIGVRVINLPWLDTVNIAWLQSVLKGTVITLDNHMISGGQGEMLAAALQRSGSNVPLHMVGLTDVPACGRNDDVLAHHKLDSLSLKKIIKQRLLA